MRSPILLFLFAMALPLHLFSNDAYRYEFSTVPDDPYKVLQYTLDNGLKVYLSVNSNEPRISTNIVVRTGSKNDPAEFTGLAHYLEHMLFKGTSKIGSLNWAKEKPLLEEISRQYELHRQTTDEAKRKAIYAKIDSLSFEASKYVATNEYDQMLSGIGARGVNAYTSLERTVYISDIPTTEMEKWMAVEAERFRELTLRLFHTELEAVYEEFNRGQDNDGRRAYAAMMESLFPSHTYGTQTTIGRGEHLKNPSMVKIQEYFETYYVPNNMAIVMVGDLDPDKTLDLIIKHFGGWKRGPDPLQYEDPGQTDIKDIVVRDLNGTEAEFSRVAYRIGGIDSEDAMMADLVANVLNNGEAGIFDQNLNTQQQVLRAFAYSSSMKDYSVLGLGVSPRQDQSLEEATALLMEQVKKLKRGKFDEELLASIIRNEKKRQMVQAESNRWKASTMIDAFVFDKPWSYYAHYYQEMSKISKGRVASWANKNMRNNYVLVNKRLGERESLRIEKPEITAVQVNRGKSSAFRKKWEAITSTRSKASFVDFKKDIGRADAFSNLPVFHVENKTNELFELNYIFDMGSRHDKELALAIQYLPYLGTDDLGVEEIKRKFYDLGLDYSVYAGQDRTYVKLSGLNESLEEGIKLFEQLLSKVTADEESYLKLVDGIVKKRADAKLNKHRILFSGMMNYAMYGRISPVTDIIPEAELRAINPGMLADRIRDLRNYKHRVFYYGPSSKADVVGLIRQLHPVKLELKEYPDRREYDYSAQLKDVVYFVDYDQVQAEVLMISRDEGFNPSNMGPGTVFNLYFGSGLSSIVFQEIRESRALAYSSYAVYSTPSRKDQAHFVRAYIGTQADKLNEALGAMTELMNNMPREKSQFEQSLTGALKQMESNPVTKASIYWAYQSALDKGLSSNPRKEMYESMSQMDLDAMQKFFDERIKGRSYNYLVIGKKELLDMEALEKLGKVQELSLEDVFGY